MALGKRLINTGAEAACLTETTDIFGDSSGVALYSLDYDASTAPDGTDYSGTPTDVDFGVGGQINYGARFNGSSSYISIPALPITTSDDVTFSAWVKGSSDATDATIVSTLGENGLEFRVQNSAVRAVYRKSGSWYASSTVSITSDVWNHVVLTYEQGVGFNIYVNNNTPTAYTETGTLQVLGSSNSIGKYANGSSGYYDGSIDQVRIFTSALTSDQVEDLYEETACVHTATTTDNYFPLADGSSDAVAYYKLDNSAEDSVGSNDGTETDIEYRFGRYGQAAVFNGSSSRINISSLSLFDRSSFAISCWVKSTNVTSTGRIIGHEDSGGSAIIIRGDDVIIDARDAGASASTTLTMSTTNNQWHHVCLVNDSNHYYLYLDGVEVDDDNYGYNPTSATAGSGHQLAFGYRKINSDSYWSGDLDQVRIFSTALTSAQVSQLYNEKPETDTSNFKTVLYEGNGDTTNPTYISNVGIDLESNGGLVWVKSRTTTYNHLLMDSVRGTTSLTSNDTTDEQSNFNRFQSYEANGFMILANNNADSYKINRVSQDFVAWVWKGGGDAVTIQANTIGNTVESDVSANTEAGFSIVKWTGDATSNPTVAHGLNQEPDLYIVKELDNGTVSWLVGGNSTLFPETATSASFLRLNTTDDIDQTGINTFGNSGDNLIKVGARTNNGEDSIAYCFHSVSGYSKIGSYEGLGTSTVTVSGLGFKPSWIIVKNADDTSNWNIYDSRRSGNDSGWGSMDTMNDILYPNLNIAEVEGGSTHVFTANSDGFVVGASNHLQNNKAGDTFIYMAFK